MKKMLAAAAVLAMSVPVFAADVGVSVSISQPGVYGRIDIGRYPQPQVVYAQPEPVYMWVPPGHRKNWRKHCGQYNACGAPVYFVRDDWYDGHVRGHDRRDRDDDRGPGKGRGKGHGNRD